MENNAKLLRIKIKNLEMKIGGSSTNVCTVLKAECSTAI